MSTTDTLPGVWILIPARGGSREIPRKNLRELAGKPLLRHVVDSLAPLVPRERLVVSTDSSEIAQLCDDVATVHQRSPETAQSQSTLDEVALEFARAALESGAKPSDLLVTVQPTSPFLSAAHVREAVAKLQAGAGCVISVTEDRHLRWTLDEDGRPRPLYKERVNRQWLPVAFRETGGIIATRLERLVETSTRVNAPIELLTLDPVEGLDIDSHADWATAAYYARRRRIVLRADGGPDLGMGHLYRCMSLANELSEHDLTLVTRSDGDHLLGYERLQQSPFRVRGVADEEAFFTVLEELRPQLCVLDVLDTTATFVTRVRERSGAVVSFEDLGDGAPLADVVVNDLYTDLYPRPNHWYGVQNSVLAPHFELFQTTRPIADQVHRVLVAFGGTDPQDLTRKALGALREAAFGGEVTVVLGPGYTHPPVEPADFELKGQTLRSVENMAEVMGSVDLALTSAGRTVTELMTVGVPTMVVCQNLRELRHTHASSPFGVINLGLGEYVNAQAIAGHFRMLSSQRELRASMRQRAHDAVRERSNREIVRRLLEATQQRSDSL